MNKKILVSLLLLLTKLSFATVAASIDHSQLSLGQSLTLTIDLSQSSDDPNLEPLKQNFEVYGSSISSQTNIINGHISSEKTLMVNLTPKNQGAQQIPAIQVGNDSTAPIQIQVSGASKVDATASKNSPVFVEASLNRQASYVGVPVLYSVKLYYSVSLNNLSMNQIQLSNANIKEQGKPLQYQSRQAGKEYQVVEQKFLITPTKSGTLTIPAAQVKGSMIAAPNPNDFFSISGQKPFSVNSKALTLKIKPIPTGISIADWLPAKQVTLNENWSTLSANLKVGEPVTRTVTITAQGVAATSIPEIDLAVPTGVNAYPDKTASDSNSNNDNLIATKTFKIVYVPTKAGNLNFPEIKVKWWNVNSEAMKTVSLAAKSFVVSDTALGLATANNAASATLSQLAKAASQTKIGQPNSKISTKPWSSLTIFFAGLWLLTLAILFAVYLNYRKRQTNQAAKNEPQQRIKPSKNNPLNSVLKACQNKDSAALNLALISWASWHWQKKVQTISDLKDLANNTKLASLIDKLNLALYRNQTFEDFTDLAEEVRNISLQKLITKGNDTLQELYPN